MPAKFKVIVSQRAFADLDEILVFVAASSAQNARAVIDALWSDITSLTLFPFRHRVHQRRRDAARSVYVMPSHPFLIYYQIIQTNLAVRVLRVIHGARRQPRRLP